MDYFIYYKTYIYNCLLLLLLLLLLLVVVVVVVVVLLLFFLLLLLLLLLPGHEGAQVSLPGKIKIQNSVLQQVEEQGTLDLLTASSLHLNLSAIYPLTSPSERTSHMTQLQKRMNEPCLTVS
jgi:hypothetical protein